MPYLRGLRSANHTARAHAIAAALPTLGNPNPHDWIAPLELDDDPLGNNDYGCCLPAGLGRQLQAWNFHASGSTWKPTRDTTLALYAAVSPFVVARGGPDDGTDLDTAEGYVSNVGLTDTERFRAILPVALNPGDIDGMLTASDTFGGIWCCWNLPQSAEEDPVNWLDASGPFLGGHFVYASRGTTSVLSGASWGLKQQISAPFIEKCLQAACAGISREWLEATGLTPDGLDWSALTAAMRS